MSLPFIAFDTETWLIEPGRGAPPMVCLTYDSPALEEPVILTTLEHDAEIHETIRAWLTEPGLILVAHNTAFDLAVLAVRYPDLLPLIFKAYEDNRIADTMVWEMLYDIATGNMFSGRKYNLAAVVKRRLDFDVEGKVGPDVWRLRYQELDETPLAEWPPAAIDYAVHDATYAKLLWQDIQNHGVPDDLWRQTRAAWCLHLMGMWGVRTDPERVAALEKELHEHVDGEIEYLLTTPLYKQAKPTRAQKAAGEPGKISQDTKETALAVARAYTGVSTGVDDQEPKSAAGKLLLKHLPNRRDVLSLVRAWEKAGVVDSIPRTDKGGISRDAETLRSSGDKTLLRLAEISGDKKLLTAYVPLLQQRVINPFWNVLLVSGRASCRKPSLQVMPKKPGVRECFIPQDGFWYLFADYHVAEMCGLAQTQLDWYGESSLADLLRGGKDPHKVVGADILGISYKEFCERYDAGDPVAKSTRTLAKVPNFGLGGGMGKQRFYDQIREDLAESTLPRGVRCEQCYGTGKLKEKACPCIGIPELDLDYAGHLKDLWLERFPEMRWLYRDVGNLVEDGLATTVQLRSGRIRGGVGYCDGCNDTFQPVIADGAKCAMWLITKECYLVEDSPLYGCRPVVFIHDEFGLEVPADYDIARPAAARLSELMVEGMAAFVPDVPIKAEAALMRRWYKAAEPVEDDEGNLMLWEPK